MDDLTPEHNYAKPWWQVARAYFDSHRFTEHQIDSYNLFMTKKLADIITNSELSYTKDNTNYILSFENVYVQKPVYTEPNGVIRKLKPQTCRIRNLNYMCQVYVDITRYIVDESGKLLDQTTYNDIFIGSIPAMVGSLYCHLHGKDREGLIKNSECPYDPHGYFIINGIEKVLMSQDRMAHNEIFVFKSKEKDCIRLPGSDASEIDDTPKTKNRSLPCAWSAEVRSFTEDLEPNISSVYIKMSREQLDKGEDSRLYVELPGFRCPVAWPLIFIALGVTDRNEMISYVCDPDDDEMVKLLLPSLDCEPVKTQKEALDYLSDFVTAQKDEQMNQLKYILRSKMFQNVADTFMKKYYYGYMTRLLLSTMLGRRKQDDRDHYGKKRVVTAGSLINDLFKSIWKRVLRETKNILEKKRNDITKVFYGKFTSYLKTPFSTGNWTATKTPTKAAKAGISQLLNRHNYISTLSNLRRIVTPGDKNSKIVKPRHLHNSHWNYICPVETPEGQATGLIKNMALMTSITVGSPSEPIIDWLKMIGYPLLEDLFTHEKEIQKWTKVFVNSSWVTSTQEPEKLVVELRELRRDGKILRETSISMNNEGVRIFTDEGRVTAPFLIIRAGEIPTLPEKYTWDTLVNNNIVEYLDSTESETMEIAECPWDLADYHTHSVIHPSLMLGVSGSTAPFPDHNQCIWEDEPVYMADGTAKAIKDVKVGDEVVTFDPETLAHGYTKVSHTYVGPTDKIIYTAETLSGRKITATFDHRFMTSVGWQRLEDIPAYDLDRVNEHTPLVGLSAEPMPMPHVCPERQLILDAETYHQKCVEYGIFGADEHVQKCMHAGLLPLYNNHPKLGVIARLYGFSLTAETRRNTIETAATDIQYLDLDRETLSVLLICLGVLHCRVPQWILQGSQLVQREFIASFHGLNCEPIEQTFDCLQVNCSRQFANKCVSIITSLGVHARDSTGGYQITGGANLVKYFDTIGYRYNAEKNITSFQAVEYCRLFSSAHEQSVSLPAISFDRWKQITKFSAALSTLFVPLRRKRVALNVMIADITTESSNQSFLCGQRFCVHNSPRNIYQSSMGKQALGLFALNFLHRYDTNAHVLCYPQKPLVNTKPMQMLHAEELPAGQNMIVAIATAGYNQEDSVVVNQGSLDRGLLRSIMYGTQSESHHKKGNTVTVIKKPDKIVNETRLRGYSKLDDDGLTREATPVALRDIIVGKVTSTSDSSRDASVTVKSNGMEEESVVEFEQDGRHIYAGYKGSAVVDQVLLTLNEDSFRTNKVRIRQTRIPQVGDKVASRSAQKGIIGMIYPQEDMPFSEETGIVPDLIMNPNAIPSRMTVAQPLECVLGKLCALMGGYADCTPFEPDFSEDTIAEQLAKQGFDPYGDEVLVNGFTGERIPCKIFIGPTYYQRLKHMVDDKIHCLTPDHEVLTRGGWKPIGNVTFEDRVATLDNGKLLYEKPVNVWNYDYDGQVVHFRSPEVDQLVTGNHRMWVSIDGRGFDYCQARDLVHTPANFKKSALWSSPGLTVYPDRIGERMPDWVFELSPLKARELLRDLPMHGTFEYVSDIQQLCLHAGWAANVEEYPKGWRAVLTKNEPTVFGGTLYNYIGKVHCLEVPSGVFYVRRNGLATWTGNSRDQNGPRETLTRQPVEGRKRGGGFKMGEILPKWGIKSLLVGGAGDASKLREHLDYVALAA